MTVARPGPTSWISAKKQRKASALQNRPSTRTDSRVWPDGTDAGAEASAGTVSTSPEMPIEAVTGPSGSSERSFCLMIIGPAA